MAGGRRPKGATTCRRFLYDTSPPNESAKRSWYFVQNGNCFDFENREEFEKESVVTPINSEETKDLQAAPMHQIEERRAAKLRAKQEEAHWEYIMEQRARQEAEDLGAFRRESSMRCDPSAGGFEEA